MWFQGKLWTCTLYIHPSPADEFALKGKPTWRIQWQSLPFNNCSHSIRKVRRCKLRNLHSYTHSRIAHFHVFWGKVFVCQAAQEEITGKKFVLQLLEECSAQTHAKLQKLRRMMFTKVTCKITPLRTPSGQMFQMAWPHLLNSLAFLEGSWHIFGRLGFNAANTTA